MAEKKYTEHLGLTQQSEEDFVDGEEISRSFKVLDQEVFSIREKTNNLKNEDHYYSNDYYTFPEKINSITYGEGKYVAAGEYNIYSSIDKRSWNISDSRSGISAAFGNGKYMAVVFYSGYYSLLTSPDGTGWTEIQILEDGVQSTRRINEIAYEDGKFVIIGDGGKIYTSDGTQITVQNSNTSVDIKSIAYGNGIFLAVGYKSTTSVLLKSVDAVTWEQIPLSLQFARNPYDKITFGNGVFVIKDSRRVYTTTDGIDLAAWSTPKPPTNGEICFADDKFFLSCKSGNFISKNGTEWIDIAKEFAGKISAIKYIKDEILGTTDTNKLIGVSKYTIDGIREDVDKLNSALYPVGIVLAFVNGFDPNKSLLGEWEPIAKGQTLVGVNESDPDFNSVEKSGGLKDVTLSIKQIPVHSHQESDLSYVYTDEHPANNSIVTTNQNGRQNINMNIKSKTYTKNAGEGGAHSNLQPYITVFYWVRRK
ncbi:phage baseplate protein [Anaerostipes caccae]|uniref:phage baseplate protein n=1 Tax=Anaerostipes caccae TaxID=105841 RepID=UPI00241E0390|nr:hypothetical protein [Anaerostipes caccae]